MNISLRFLLSLSLSIICSTIQAMGTDPKDASTYSVVKDEAFELQMKQFKNRAKIQELARILEASLNSNEEYYEISVRKYRNSEDLKELAAQSDLIKPIRHAIKAISQLAAVDDIDPTILENVISSIVPMKIKYVASNPDNLPATAKAKKLPTPGYIVKDDTTNFKNAMLCALFECKLPFHTLTDSHQP